MRIKIVMASICIGVLGVYLIAQNPPLHWDEAAQLKKGVLKAISTDGVDSLKVSGDAIINGALKTYTTNPLNYRGGLTIFDDDGSDSLWILCLDGGVGMISTHNTVNLGYMNAKKLTVKGDRVIVNPSKYLNPDFWVYGDTEDTTLFVDVSENKTTINELRVRNTFGFNQIETENLSAGATSISITGSNIISVNGDAGGNTISTISAPVKGVYTFIFNDALVTIVNDDTHATNTVDLQGTADLVSADDLVLQLVYDGTSWYEISRSEN